MRFTVLGPFATINDDEDYTPGAPKVRQVLALLALRANQVVSMDAVITELWEENPPRSAVTTAQTYIYQLRKIFAEFPPEDRKTNRICTRTPGYVLKVDSSDIDVMRFSRMLEEGRSLLEQGATREAARVLGDALALWSGPALANVTCGPLLNGYVTHLEELRMTALELRITADMRLGRHSELIAELRSLVSLHPLNEWLYVQLMIALANAGRRGEALRAYQDIRQILNDELGLDPSTDLQQIHHMVLSSDASPIMAMSRA